MLKRYIERLVRDLVKKYFIDYDTISALVRKANKSKYLSAEYKITEDGPWIRITTSPLPEIDKGVPVIHPTDL